MIVFKYLLLSSIFIGISINGQSQKRNVNKSKNMVVEKIQKPTFNKITSEKDKLNQSQKTLRIEIINKGYWENFNETVLLRIVKVNDGNFSPILHTENVRLQISEDNMGTKDWKDENGNYSFRSISEPLKISQEFTGSKNDKGQFRNLLIENELFEPIAPISSFSFKIYSFPKESKDISFESLTKTINNYADNKLIKTIYYSHEDLMKIGGIDIDDFQVTNSK